MYVCIVFYWELSSTDGKYNRAILYFKSFFHQKGEKNCESNRRQPTNEDLEADDKQEEIHLPDRKVNIKNICYLSGKKYNKPKINKISSREALKILQSSMIWHQFPSLTNQTQMWYISGKLGWLKMLRI